MGTAKFMCNLVSVSHIISNHLALSFPLSGILCDYGIWRFTVSNQHLEKYFEVTEHKLREKISLDIRLKRS